MANATNKYVTPVGLQQPAAADLSDGTTGTGAVVEAGSPALTGVPTAPTAAFGTNTTQLASTAFVQAATSSAGVDTLNVNGSIVVTPFSFTALVNGIGPVGATEVNSFPVANNKSCMVEVPGNLSNTERTNGVIYQNATGYPLFVALTYNNTNGNLTTTVSVDGTPNPSTIVHQYATPNDTGANGAAQFFVMPGQFYKFVYSGAIGGGGVYSWREFICQNGTMTASGDLSGSKALGTVYQNTTLGVKIVSVICTGVSALSLVQAVSDQNAAPTNIVCQKVQSSTGVGAVTAFFLVPSGHYYKVTAASGSLSKWNEYSWNIPCTKSNDLALTTGQGQTRTAAATSVSVCTGTATATSVTPASWINTDPFRVRWVQLMMTNTGSAIQNCGLLMGDSSPSYRYLCYDWVHGGGTANEPRTLCGPVLPNNAYTVYELTNGTVTTQHWWEYQLG